MMKLITVKAKFCLILGRWTSGFIFKETKLLCHVLEIRLQTITNSEVIIVRTEVSTQVLVLLLDLVEFPEWEIFIVII